MNRIDKSFILRFKQLLMLLAPKYIHRAAALASHQIDSLIRPRTDRNFSISKEKPRVDLPE
jgi:hypothetical protein